jgi:hypothetical protein
VNATKQLALTRFRRFRLTLSRPVWPVVAASEHWLSGSLHLTTLNIAIFPSVIILIRLVSLFAPILIAGLRLIRLVSILIAGVSLFAARDNTVWHENVTKL